MSFTRVQSKIAQNTSGGSTSTPLAITFNSNITIGNLLIASIASFAATATPANNITDNLGNTWTLRAVEFPGPNSQYCAIYTAPVTTGGSCTVTFGYNGEAFNVPVMAIAEYSYPSGTLTFDHAVQATNTTDNPSAGSITVSGTYDLVVAAVTQFATFTEGTGFSVAQSITYQAGTYALTYEDALDVSPPSIPAAFVGSAGTNPWFACAVSFALVPTAPSFSVSPNTDTNGQSVTYTLTGSNTSWVGGTTFGISGVTGASITSQSVNSGAQTGSVTVLLDNTHIGTLTFTDSTDGATATSTVTLAGPGIPVSPSCTPGNNQNVLNWSAPTSGGLTATYNVYRGTSPGGESGTPLATSIAALTYTDTTAVNGTTYYYKIAAVNATGVGTLSSEVSGEPEPGPSFTVSPSTDTNGQSVTYTLTGTDTSWTGGTSFNIAGVTGATVTSQSVNAGAQTASVTVSLDITHTGTLTFSNTADSSTATTAVTLGTPGAPTAPACQVGNTQNTLTWALPVSGGIPATYNIYRGTTPGGESGTPIATGITVFTYVDTGLTNGQIYYYTIKGVNTTGTGPASTEVSGTPISGIGNLSAAQFLAAVAVLCRAIQPPFLNTNQTGLYVNGANQLQIPLTTGNIALGAALSNSTDGTNVYLGLNMNDPASGT